MRKFLAASILLGSLVTAAVAMAGATASSVTINSDRRFVVLGGTPTLTGTAPANSNVTITAEPQDEATRTVTVKTDSGGNWKLTVHPWVQTVYRAKAGTDSDSTIVAVRPRIQLVPRGKGRYQVILAAGRSFAGQQVVLTREVLTRPRHWVNVKQVQLTTNVRTDGTTIGSFTYKTRRGTYLRVVLDGSVADQLGYQGTKSNFVVAS